MVYLENSMKNYNLLFCLKCNVKLSVIFDVFYVGFSLYSIECIFIFDCLL